MLYLTFISGVCIVFYTRLLSQACVLCSIPDCQISYVYHVLYLIDISASYIVCYTQLLSKPSILYAIPDCYLSLCIVCYTWLLYQPRLMCAIPDCCLSLVYSVYTQVISALCIVCYTITVIWGSCIACYIRLILASSTVYYSHLSDQSHVLCAIPDCYLSLVYCVLYPTVISTSCTDYCTWLLT